MIKKTSETTPTMASIVNSYSTSTQDGYSCDYINRQKKVLYENASGTTSDITLTNDNFSNYSKLEIITKQWYFDNWKTYTIYNPSDKQQIIDSSLVSGGVWYVATAFIYFGGTDYNKLIFGNSYAFNTYGGLPTGNTIQNDSATRPKIYKIVGYK